jgi:D-alanyl-lipoteichoic acid acyltransferase DltB (MBOAT superfamily)
MLFNSFPFAIFLPLVFFLYWGIPHKYRWVILLIASCYFYMSWNIKYIILIFLTTVVAYFCAILVEKSESRLKKKIWLIFSSIICLGILVVFKYFNFFSDTVIRLLQAISIPVHSVTLKVLLPVGISFYTFQTLSYIIDIYKGNQKAERHFGIFALYVLYFPQLVAGPIERPGNLIPQFKDPKTFDCDMAISGFKLMVIGFFKKLIIATLMAKYVDAVYTNVTGYSGFAFILATLFFSFQIYCDFSGYSDIARGTSKLMGIDLMVNFNIPYLSKSFKEFWNRWHISLSSWLRDYVYIPLGGSRVSKWKHQRNLMITFLLSGLWHGSNYTFIIWGGLHGFFLIAEDFLKKTIFNRIKMTAMGGGGGVRRIIISFNSVKLF